MTNLIVLEGLVRLFANIESVPKCLKIFFKVVDGHYPPHQSNELGYADSILAAASSKGILHKSAYRSCAYVAPTSNIVERLFSACKRTMTDYCRVMEPPTLDTHEIEL